MIDLHTHTNVSDGDLTPFELIDYAVAEDIEVIAITDHDTLDGYTPDLIDYASNKLSLIPGIELSTADAQSGQKIHVLGLNINLNHQPLRQMCHDLRASRENYALEVAKKLKLCKINFNPDKLLASGEIITKAHVAREVLSDPSNLATLIERYGSIPLQGTFIEGYLIKGCPAFVPKSLQLSTDQAIKLIQKSGGLAFCAHPSFNAMRGFDFDQMKQLILRNNFDGVEAINIQYDKSRGDERFDMVDQFLEFAHNNNLLVSGGSDFHSTNTELWGNHSSIGLKNESYQVDSRHLDAILNRQ